MLNEAVVSNVMGWVAVHCLSVPNIHMRTCWNSWPWRGIEPLYSVFGEVAVTFRHGDDDFARPFERRACMGDQHVVEH